MALFEKFTKKLTDKSNQPSATVNKTAAKKTGKKPAGKPVADKTNIAKAAKYAEILLAPHITEKSTHFTKENKYVFKIHPQANKIEIAKAIFAIYNIKPTKLNIITSQGKSTHFGRIKGKRKNWKKAIVTLPTGKTLDIYEGI